MRKPETVFVLVIGVILLVCVMGLLFPLLVPPNWMGLGAVYKCEQSIYRPETGPRGVDDCATQAAIWTAEAPPTAPAWWPFGH